MPVETAEVCRCSHCGHRWLPKGLSLPVRCALCKSRTWYLGSVPPDSAFPRLLNPRQQAFVEAYFRCGVGARAARQAGYRDPKSAAAYLMRHPLVLEEIQEVAEHIREMYPDIASLARRRRRP